MLVNLIDLCKKQSAGFYDPRIWGSNVNMFEGYDEENRKIIISWTKYGMVFQEILTWAKTKEAVIRADMLQAILPLLCVEQSEVSLLSHAVLFISEAFVSGL